MIERDDLLQMRRIAGKSNPRIKEWASLADRSGRDATRLTLAEGAKLVSEGLGAGEFGIYRPCLFLVSDTGAEHREAGDLLKQAAAAGVECFSLSDECMAKMSGLKSHEGVALVLETPVEQSLAPDAFGAPDARWLVACGIQDPGNAGALSRIALATGMTGCVFVEGVDPRSPKFLRGSMGAVFRIPCHALKAAEFEVLARSSETRLLETSSAADGSDFRKADYSPPLAILVGGERGMPQALAGLASESIHIPLRGGVESLNLAVAAGIVLFEAEQAWR